jgi:hypothetical protein
MLMPVGRTSGAALEDAGGCGFDCATDLVCPDQTMAAIAAQQPKFLSVMTFPRFPWISCLFIFLTANHC